jgi:pimeloyl-ACP methyl ester carboxylesterase
VSDGFVGGIGTRWLAGLLLGVTLLVGACGGTGRDEGAARQAPLNPAPASTVPPTTAGAISKSCMEPAEAAKAFHFTTSAGATLAGVVLGAGRTGLVLGHQVGSDLCEWLPAARALAGHGYQVLAFDFEGFGDSEPGSGSGVDVRLTTDLAAAAEQLRRRGARTIFLVGSSMGGTAVLSAATRIRPPAAGVVSLSGPATFQELDAAAAVSRLRVPVLFIVSAEDQPFADDARAMYKAVRIRDKRLVVISGGHGTSMLQFGDDAPKAMAALRDFIDDHIRH